MILEKNIATPISNKTNKTKLVYQSKLIKNINVELILLLLTLILLYLSIYAASSVKQLESLNYLYTGYFCIDVHSKEILRSKAYLLKNNVETGTQPDDTQGLEIHQKPELESRKQIKKRKKKNQYYY